MTYEKQSWIDGQTTVYAANMMHIEQGIADAAKAINELQKNAGNTEEAGITKKTKQLVATLFANAAYSNATMQATLQELCTEWGIDMPVRKPDTSSNGLPTPLYMLAAQKTFVQSKEEFIDTGLKLFETVNDSMELTLLATFSVAAGTYTGISPAALFDCFSDSSNDQRGVMGCTWGNGNFGVNVYQSSGVSNTLVDDTKLQLAIQIKGGKYRMTQNGTFGAWSNISNYGTGKTVSKSLLIGASWGDGTAKRFYFGGTVYDFQVYNKVLTDIQVKTLLAAGLGGSTVTPSQPDTPNNGLPTPRYKLAAPKTFVPANKEFIDTGIKPFATIDTGMNLTVYATFTVADSVASTVSVLYDCYSIAADGDKRGMMAATWGNGTVGVNMFTYASHFVKIESGKKIKLLLQIKGTQFRFLSYGSLTDWKNVPNYAANKTVDRSLIVGASWTDVNNVEVAGKTRFFGGTVYDFQVFDTALTDAQITTLMEAN